MRLTAIQHELKICFNNLQIVILLHLPAGRQVVKLLFFGKLANNLTI